MLNNKRSFPHGSDDLYRPAKKRTFQGGGHGFGKGNVIPMSKADLNDVKADLKQALYHLREALRSGGRATTDIICLQPLANAEQVIKQFVREAVSASPDRLRGFNSRPNDHFPVESTPNNLGVQHFTKETNGTTPGNRREFTREPFDLRFSNRGGGLSNRGKFESNPPRWNHSPTRFNRSSSPRFELSPERFKRVPPWKPRASSHRLLGQGIPNIRVVNHKVKNKSGNATRVKTPRNGNLGLPPPAPPKKAQTIKKPKKKVEAKKCDICNVVCNSQSQWEQHLGGVAHKARLAGEEPPVRPNREDAIDKAEKPPPLRVQCEICNLNLKESDYKQHINGKKHKKKLAQMEIQDGGMGFGQGNKGWVLRCEVCRSSCNGEVQYAEHLSGKQHQLAVERKEKDMLEHCEENMSLVVIKSKGN